MPRRHTIIRIASELPVGDPTRRKLLAILKVAEDGDEEEKGGGSGKPSGKFLEFMEEVGDQRVKNPDTGNEVYVKSLKGPKGQKLVQKQFQEWLAKKDDKKDDKKDSGGGKAPSVSSVKEQVASKAKEVAKALTKALEDEFGGYDDFDEDRNKFQDEAQAIEEKYKENPSVENLVAAKGAAMLSEMVGHISEEHRLAEKADRGEVEAEIKKWSGRLQDALDEFGDLDPDHEDWDLLDQGVDEPMSEIMRGYFHLAILDAEKGDKTSSLRTAAIKIASELPVGDSTRRKILAALESRR